MPSPLLEGAVAMKRKKRFTIRRIALGLAVAAVVAPAAQAEPIGSYERQSSVEIPYLSAGIGVSHLDFDPVSTRSGQLSTDIPYLSQVGADVVLSADDLSLSRPSNAGSPSTASGRTWDVPTPVSGFAVAVALLIAASAVALRHSRRTRP